VNVDAAASKYQQPSIAVCGYRRKAQGHDFSHRWCRPVIVFHQRAF
jgi:hypothetical protein